MMAKLIGVKFSKYGFPKRFNADAVEDVKVEEYVVAKPFSGEGERVGIVECLYRCIPPLKTAASFPKVLRKATPQEQQGFLRKQVKEKEAIRVCKEKVQQHELGMKISTVHFDEKNNKLIYHFTAERRVDFRNLVKDLAHTLRAKIELWQIGVRDEAKILDGYGPCGCRLCCSNHLTGFESISIRMAKQQDISLSPAKLSGSCGRLMCCLSYECAMYKELRKEFPALGSTARTADITGVIIDRNILRQTIVVRDQFDKNHTVPLSDLIPIESDDSQGIDLGVDDGKKDAKREPGQKPEQKADRRSDRKPERKSDTNSPQSCNSRRRRSRRPNSGRPRRPNSPQGDANSKTDSLGGNNRQEMGKRPDR